MCGIFGIIAASDSKIDAKRLQSATQKLFLLSETRGKDASGALINDAHQIDVIKTPQRVGQLIQSDIYKKLIAKHSQAYQTGNVYCVLGHTRMVTNGSEYADNNNQPVIIAPNYCLLHNGIIVNDELLWKLNPNLKRNHQVDTEVFGALLQGFTDQSVSWLDAIRTTFSLIQGANTLAVFHTNGYQLFIGTSNGSLYWAYDKIAKVWIFASEKLIVNAALHELRLTSLPVNHLISGDYLDIDLHKFIYQQGQLTDSTIENSSSVSNTAYLVKPVVVHSLPFYHLTSIHHANELSQISQLLDEGYSRYRDMRRCTSCLLPSTFPFIEFDEKGVCQLCLNHRPRQLMPQSQFERLVERARQKQGDGNCLVPISGGRDSCYGLHYVSKHLNLRPVAYTYDWGFVTDLARRNISRMCGALGVEHVLVAADIRQKRENVRKNVIAWLRQPSLGMIPLFMAGDKMFFHYASLIRKQMDLGPIIFSMNWLEQTGFKAGFAGINQFKALLDNDDTKGKTHDLPIKDLFTMMGYYGKQFVTNSQYINSTLIDTIAAFGAFYLKSKDYFSLFDYLPWDEATVSSTIIEQYDWETANDTKSTWRIGDGTAPFYNYIYHCVAGFSEHETFRSNQIREGLITRDAAMQAVELENQPRAESFKWYCDVVGLNAIEVIKKINEIPPITVR